MGHGYYIEGGISGGDGEVIHDSDGCSDNGRDNT